MTVYNQNWKNSVSLSKKFSEKPITYFRRKANQKLKYNSDDLKEKLIFELKENGIIGDSGSNAAMGNKSSGGGGGKKKKKEEEETKEE